MIEIDKSVVGPEKVTQVFAPDEFTGVIDKVHENAEGLLAESDAGAAPAQLGIARINLEDAKTPDSSLIFEGFQEADSPSSRV